MPALGGLYVFGDLASTAAEQARGDFSGRLFYSDLTSGLIQQLRIGEPERELGLFLKGFGTDDAGDVYVVADANIGPAGTGGVVYKI